MEQLKDIKAIENITIDYSIYLAILSIIFGLLILSILIYMFLKFRKKLTRREKLIKYLKSLDFNRDAKTIAYEFTIYGKECLDTQHKDEFYHIISKLESYKYKKTTNSNLSDDLEADIREYIRVRL